MPKALELQIFNEQANDEVLRHELHGLKDGGSSNETGESNRLEALKGKRAENEDVLARLREKCDAKDEEARKLKEKMAAAEENSRVTEQKCEETIEESKKKFLEAERASMK